MGLHENQFSEKELRVGVGTGKRLGLTVLHHARRLSPALRPSQRRADAVGSAAVTIWN